MGKKGCDHFQYNTHKVRSHLGDGITHKTTCYVKHLQKNPSNQFTASGEKITVRTVN